MTTKYVTWSGGPSGDYTTDGTSDETEINNALSYAASNAPCTIILRGPHTYNISAAGAISIGSSTIWTAEAGVTLKIINSANYVASGTPVVRATSSTVHDIEIHGFTIDGNRNNQSVLSGDGYFKFFWLKGSSGGSISNISIHDMTMSNLSCDGVRITYGSNITFYNNTCSNLQHTAVFYEVVTGGEIYNNTIKAIVCAGVRLDNCNSVKIHNNNITPFTDYTKCIDLSGNDISGTNLGTMANGIQVGDAHGYSKITDIVTAYDNTISNLDCGICVMGDTTITSTRNVRIYNNTLTGCGLRGEAVWDAGIGVLGWGDGLKIDHNIIQNCHSAGIIITSAVSGSHQVTISDNNILNTVAKVSTSANTSLSSSGYGIYNIATSSMQVVATNNYLSGNVGNYSGVSSHTESTSSISSAGAGNSGSDNNNNNNTNIPIIINPSDDNSAIVGRYIPTSRTLMDDWLFNYYITDELNHVHTAYINGIPFYWQDKSVDVNKSVSTEHPPGTIGWNVGDYGFEGSTLNLLCWSFPDKLDDIISTWYSRFPSILEIGYNWKGDFLLGHCIGHSTSIKLTDGSVFPAGMVPYSISFLLDKPYRYSTTKRVRSRRVISDGQTWNSDDTVPSNLLRNGTMENWTSSITSSWALENSAADNNWTEVCYAPADDFTLFDNDTLVAVANSGTNRVMYSIDASSWTAASIASNSWRSVCWGSANNYITNGLFVAVADAGTNLVSTSPDAINWTARTAAADISWASICFSNYLDLFCAVGTTTTSTGTQVDVPDSSGNVYSSLATAYGTDSSHGTSWQYKFTLAPLGDNKQYRIDQVYATIAAQTNNEASPGTSLKITLLCPSYNGGVETQIAEWFTQSSTYAAKTQDLSILLPSLTDTAYINVYLKTPNSASTHHSYGKLFGYKYTPISSSSTVSNYVTVGQNSGSASATYFYYNPSNTNAGTILNTAITKAATMASNGNPCYVMIEASVSPYVIDTHVMCKSNVYLVGAGISSTKLKLKSGISGGTAYPPGWGNDSGVAAAGAMIMPFNCSNIRITGMTIDGSYDDYYTSEGYGHGYKNVITCYNSSNILIDTIHFSHGCNDFVMVGTCDTVEVAGCTFDTAGHDDVQFIQSSNCKAHHNTFSMRSNSGIRIDRSPGTLIYCNEFWTGSGGGSGVELELNVANSKIYNNYFHNITGSGSNYGAVGYHGMPSNELPTGSGLVVKNNYMTNCAYATQVMPTNYDFINNLYISCGSTPVASVGTGSNTGNLSSTSGLTGSGANYACNYYYTGSGIIYGIDPNNVLSLPPLSQSSSVGDSVVAMTSKDAATWTAVTGPAYAWSSVCWADPSSNIPNGLFVAVSADGHIMYSETGSSGTWTAINAPLAQNWQSVCYSSQLGRFVAVSSDGTQQVITSTDGKNWTPIATPNKNWVSVSWAPEIGMFAACANSGTGQRVMLSTDGINWKLQDTPADNQWNSICWAPAIGTRLISIPLVSANGITLVSADGITLTAQDNIQNSLFISVSSSGTGNRVMMGDVNGLYQNVAPDGWTLITTGQSRGLKDDGSFEYQILGDGSTVSPGGISQNIYPESGVYYVLSGNAYSESLSSGGAVLDIYTDGVLYTQIVWDHTYTEPTTQTIGMKFDVKPSLVTIIISGYGTPDADSIIHVDNIIFEKLSDFEMGLTGNSIQTYGTEDSIPDIEIRSGYTASSTTTVLPQTPWTTGPHSSIYYTSTSTAYTDQYSLQVTKTLPALTGGSKYQIDQVFTNLGTRHSGTTAYLKVTLQSDHYNSGKETDLVEWTTNSAVDPNLASFADNLNIIIQAGDSATFKYYLKSASTSYKAVAAALGFKYSLISTVALSGGVSLINAADPLTVMPVCDKLLPLSSIRLNADNTGSYEMSDPLSDNTYLLVSDGQKFVYYYGDGKITIGENGWISYKIDTKYPITGIPFMNIDTIYGSPRVIISTDATNWFEVDSNNTTKVSTETTVTRELNNAAGLSLAGESSFRVAICTQLNDWLQISSIFLHIDLNTMDVERIKLFANGQPNTLQAFLTAPANVLITVYSRDTKMVS